MKNYTITVNGNVYEVTVEEGFTGAASAPKAAAPAPKAAPAAAPKAAPAPAAAPAAPAGAAGAVAVTAPMPGFAHFRQKLYQKHVPVLPLTVH